MASMFSTTELGRQAHIDAAFDAGSSCSGTVRRLAAKVGLPEAAQSGSRSSPSGCAAAAPRSRSEAGHVVVPQRQHDIRELGDEVRTELGEHHVLDALGLGEALPFLFTEPPPSRTERIRELIDLLPVGQVRGERIEG